MAARLVQPGETVVLRNMKDGIGRWAAPMHVVEDRGDFVALYMQPGSTYSSFGDADGNPTRDFATATRQIRLTWQENHALNLIRFGDEYATVLYWREGTWEFRCWYINFQEPLRRHAGGFETMDLTLDLLIAPNRKGHQWKDDDEFEYGIAHGWYTKEQGEHLRRIGEGVLADARAAAPPFDEPWEEWRPDPAWGPLQLPEGWDR